MRPRIVVGARSRRQSLVVLGIAAAVVVITPFAYSLARTASSHPAADAAERIMKLEVEMGRLARELRDERSRNQALAQELVDLSRGREIDRQAYAEVQKSIAEGQQEVTSLREQLAFYRGVVSPQALQSGLHVNELRISRGTARDTYRYDLVLVQAARQETRANGRAELRFIGQDRSVQRSLSLSELALKDGEPLKFSFRHFQEFGGEFKLPANFAPKRVVVTLRPEDGRSPHVEEEFDWGSVHHDS
jgi:hypothetical protein